MTPRTLVRLTGILLLLEGLLIFVPIIILGSAINWPASLGDPASAMLPLINQQIGAVRLGYGFYLAYSVLFWPVALLTSRLIADEQTTPLIRIALGFAALSTLARCIGIIRWLVAMPALAAIYADPAATATIKDSISVTFAALNVFGGSIGEVLGVNLFAALWLAPVSLIIVRSGALPRWLGVFGLAAAALLIIGVGSAFGLYVQLLIVITTTGVQLWLLAAGVVVLRRGGAGEQLKNNARTA